MPVKKRTKAKARARKLPHHLQSAAERQVELNKVHLAAIDGGDQSFYDDGRHEELCNLLPIINEALGIRPWDDQADDIIREAIAANKEADQ